MNVLRLLFFVVLIVGGAFVVGAARASVRRLDPAGVRALVAALNAGEFGSWFDERDVMAVIEIESAFDPHAVRAEPHLADKSIGLMQVLFSTARDRGFTGTESDLFDPVANLRVGMAQLRWSWDFLAARLGREPTLEEWIGSYNVGVGNVRQGRISVAYIERWSRARERY